MQPKLGEDGKQKRETDVLPPFGPPSKRGMDVLSPDFTRTRDALDDNVKSVKVTVRGTGALVEGAKSGSPGNPATTCSDPDGIAVAGTTNVPVAVLLLGPE